MKTVVAETGVQGKPVAADLPWWKWLLLYPTVVVAVLGAIPTFADLIKAALLPVHVPAGKARDAQEQLDLLTANLACTQQAMNHPSITHAQIMIGALVCDTGDVAIVAQNPSEKDYPNPFIVPLKVIVGKKLVAQESVLDLLSPIASAHAQAGVSPAGPAATVICQRPPDAKGNFLRRIKQPDGRCIDIVSNAYNRQVVSQTPAPCEPTC